MSTCQTDFTAVIVLGCESEKVAYPLASEVNSNFTSRNWDVLDALLSVADQLERPAAQVALAWLAAQPGVTAPIVGASKLEQLQSNLGSLEVHLPPEQLEILNQVNAPEPTTPSSILTPEVKQAVFGGAKVQGWR